MYLLQVDFGTPAFDDVLNLRNEILRKPLNLTFTTAQLTAECKDYHFGCYNHKGLLLGTLLMKAVSSTELKMRQVAVAKSKQGHGVGTFMVQKVESWMLNCTNYRNIQLAARQEAVVFYKRLDYVVEGQPFTEVGIPHRHMVKKL